MKLINVLIHSIINSILNHHKLKEQLTLKDKIQQYEIYRFLILWNDLS